MAKPKEKELGGTRKMSKGTKIVIGVFAVIMAFSMMLPSLTAIFGNAGSQETEEAESADTDAETKDAEAKDDKSKDEKSEEEKKKEEAKIPDNESLKSLAENNADAVEKYTARLEKDENNLAALLRLGETYMNWGYSAMNSSSTDEEKAYSKGLLQSSMEYFDRYLKLNDSPTVKTDRALAQYYSEDREGAVEALKKVCDENADFPLGWAQLGYLYESQYDYEKATEAYQKAAELDAEDEYGIKSYANQRLIAMNSKVDSPSDPGDAGFEGDTQAQSELMQKLTESTSTSSSNSFNGAGGDIITL